MSAAWTPGRWRGGVRGPRGGFPSTPDPAVPFLAPVQGPAGALIQRRLRREFFSGRRREPPHHRGRTFASRTAFSRKRLRVDPSILRENAVPERKVRPRREPQSPTHPRNGPSRSRLIGLCRRRRRPEPLSGRLLHEGGVLLADSRVYSTKVRSSCSTHNPWPVQPHPRAVHAEHHHSDQPRPFDHAITCPWHPGNPPRPCLRCPCPNPRSPHKP